MNKDIEVMIELQRYWDNVLRLTLEIEKCAAAVKKWKADLEKKQKEAAALHNDSREKKMAIKNHEVDLSLKDDMVKKSEAKRGILKTEKEVAALDREVEKLNADRGGIEEKLVNLYDRLEETENTIKKTAAELTALSTQSDEEVKKNEERIASLSNSKEENQRKFDGLVGELSPAVKPRFLKYSQSGNGKGIVTIEPREICGGCNFKIPGHLVQEASRNEKIVNCTNCGRFIYTYI